MRLKIILVLVVGFMLFVGGTPQAEAKDESDYIGFIPTTGTMSSTDATLFRKGTNAELFNIGTDNGTIVEILNEGIVIKGDDKKEIVASLLPDTALYSYVLDSNTAASVGVFGISASYGSKRSVIIQEYSMHRTAKDDNNVEKKYGVGIRMVVTVNEKTGSLKTIDIPSIAANVEAGKLEAVVSLDVFGISGEAVNAHMPALPEELNFTTLRQMYNAFADIRNDIYADDVTLTVKMFAEKKPRECP